jgi:FixJ family two-component response regulator
MSVHPILLVDDDPYLLSAFRRQLHGVYELDTCSSPEQALEMLKASDQFQVVVSDMQMPTMSGLDFLKQCQIVSPHTVRIMLTGNGDQSTVVNAINEGAVFRFLLKPCDSIALIRTIADAIKKYQNSAAERDAIADTQCSALKLLTDVLNTVRPSTFQHAVAARRLAAEISKEIGLKDYPVIELAAMLSYVGSISVPEQLFERYMRNETLSVKELCEIERFVESGRAMIGAFPSFDEACKLVTHQLNSPTLSPPIGSKIIRIANDYLRFCRSSDRHKAIGMLMNQPAAYDRELVEALGKVISRRFKDIEVSIAELKPGYIILQPLRTSDGVVLLEAMQQVTVRTLERLKTILDANRLSPQSRIKVTPETDVKGSRDQAVGVLNSVKVA